jgi:hypothetical protein
MSDKTNPNSVGGANEYHGFVAPKRADQSIVGPGGNTVSRDRINRNSDAIDKSAPNAAFPLGKPNNFG